MSFRCDFCHHPAPVGAKPVLIVVAREEVQFSFRSHANAVKTVEGMREYVPDNGGRGKQIRKEKKACPNCAKKHASENEEVKLPS